MLLLLCDTDRTPDLVLFADTGGERPETYDHVQEMWLWCRLRGIEFKVVDNGSPEKGRTLEENCLKRRELPSLAYGFKGCSVKWKRQPMDRYIRDRWQPARDAWARGEKVIRYIGIDAGEVRRKQLPPDDKFVYRYPLFEAGIDREGCIELIKSHGLAVPGKSSCFFCPAMRKEEILALPADLQKRAVFMEHNAVEARRAREAKGEVSVSSIKGLGRSHFSWEELLTGKAPTFEFDNPAPCDCMDGDDE